MSALQWVYRGKQLLHSVSLDALFLWGESISCNLTYKSRSEKYILTWLPNGFHFKLNRNNQNMLTLWCLMPFKNFQSIGTTEETQAGHCTYLGEEKDLHFSFHRILWTLKIVLDLNIFGYFYLCLMFSVVDVCLFWPQ